MANNSNQNKILLLGHCGLERLAAPLRDLTGAEVTVAGWTQTELIKSLQPALVYVDLFGWDIVAPLAIAAVTRRPHEADVQPLRAVVGALTEVEAHAGVVYRGLRRPSTGAFGLLGSEEASRLNASLDALAAIVEGRRVLDVAGLWQREGLLLDDTLYGLGHGEPLDLSLGPALEARWLHALWRAKTQGPIKCIVLDLDDTLIHGEVAADEFHDRNPAYLPRGSQPTRPLLEGWWRLKRGLHEALRIAANRGIILALATRNAPDIIQDRWHKRPATPDHNPGLYHRMYDDLPAHLREAAFHAHPWMLDALALGPADMTCIEAGFAPKSQMCARIADRLGISLSALAFIDDSPFERQEVQQNAPEVLVLDDSEVSFRAQLLLTAPFTAWDLTEEARLRPQSYRSRAQVVEASAEDGLLAFLQGLSLKIGVRPAVAADVPRAQELLLRTHQLDLTGARPSLSPHDLAGVYIGWCQDRIADHGLVAVGVFRHQRLEAWVCSCRVLPHRVAASLLWAMLCYHPSALVERVPTPRNGATLGLIEEARQGPAPWVLVEAQENLRTP